MAAHAGGGAREWKEVCGGAVSADPKKIKPHRNEEWDGNS